MAAPPLRLVERDCRDILELLRDVVKEYRWLYPMSYAKAATAGEGRIAGRVARPTETIGALNGCACQNENAKAAHRCSQGRARAGLERAGKGVVEARRALVRALAGLQGGLTDAGGPGVAGAGSGPQVSAAELAQSRAAKVRRGETYGEA
jgi:hypothetical protein